MGDHRYKSEFGRPYAEPDDEEWNEDDDWEEEWAEEAEFMDEIGPQLRRLEYDSLNGGSRIPQQKQDPWWTFPLLFTIGWVLLSGVVALLFWLTQWQYGTVGGDAPGTRVHRVANFWPGLLVDLGEVCLWITSIAWVLMFLCLWGVWVDTRALKR